MSKYRNKKITVDGVMFDSIKEYQRACELSLLERAGAITDLQRQVKFVLVPVQYGPPGPRSGKGRLLERERSYIADFVYTENGEQVVEDVKGYRTETYKLKRALMLYLYGIRIKEV